MSGKARSKDKSAKQVEAKATEAAPPPATTPTPLRQPSGPAEVLGDVVWLMTQSPNHKHLFIADLEWLVLPPVMLRQFRLVRGKDKPQAFVTWAMLNEEAEQRLMAGHTRLRPSDWNAGDRAWIVDLVAPFGGQEAVLKEIKQRLFADKPLKLLQPGKDGKPVAGEVKKLGSESLLSHRVC
ncbi:MAG: toxin-activating lysine-acyltransferase [Alphaproteobacteria bacterium]|nr:toxin-activating lysine-acyltransferase [Alphaproteobacteria bacterium]